MSPTKGLDRHDLLPLGVPARSISVKVVRTASESKKKPPTTSSPGDDARRWREGTAAPRDAEIARLGVERRVPVHVEDDDAIRRL